MQLRPMKDKHPHDAMQVQSKVREHKIAMMGSTSDFQFVEVVTFGQVLDDSDHTKCNAARRLSEGICRTKIYSHITAIHRYCSTVSYIF
jgi:hypothetical protein